MALKPKEGDEKVAPEDPYSEAISAELHCIFLKQGRRFPFATLVVVWLLVFVALDSASMRVLLTWAGVVSALAIIRQLLCVAYANAGSTPQLLQRRLRIVVTVWVLSGLVVGAGALIWFPVLSLEERIVFSIAYLAAYTGAVVVSLSSPTSSFLFGAGVLGPLAFAWMLSARTPGLIIALILLVMLIYVREAAGDAYDAIRAAIRSKLREEELVRRMEQHGVELETAMRAKSQFLAAASHDLRQPVTSMNLLLSALFASRDAQSVRNVASKFEAPLRALEEILSSLLEVSRLEAGIIEAHRRVCTPDEIIAPVVAEFKPRAAARRLNLRATNDEAELFTDPELVRRILRNLVDNAIKFTDEGSIQIDLRAEGSAMLLSVTDSGRGIPNEIQNRVFDDYFQGENPHRDRAQGLGLGLSIVRRLVGLLGGEAKLTSAVGRGSRFDLRLPNAIAPYHAGGGSGERAARYGTRLSVSNILVVEDDRLVVDAMSTLFRTLGIEARFALDGDEALMVTALGRFIPDVALVDYGLPGAIDGIALIRELRVRLTRCVFVLVTGDTRPEVLRRAADSGIPVLHKPITVERLNEKLEELTAREG
ncbi:MAG: response regulator [Burkholderiaceae bacterium]|nr:response regulator [Burkholderiaceae bacterium]